MSSDNGENESMLARAFLNLGATPDQAGVMAAQLLKRARQIAVECGTSEEAALAGLLEKIIAGHRGEYSPDVQVPREGGKSG